MNVSTKQTKEYQSLHCRVRLAGACRVNGKRLFYSLVMDVLKYDYIYSGNLLFGKGKAN